MSGTLPNFLIIGAHKSGTTSLHSYLRSHPDVFMAPGKELHCFDEHWDEGLEWYKSEFAGVTTQSAVGEATPNYMYSGEAITRMAEVLPQAKLVAILRNPVGRAYSHYWHERVRGREKLSFGNAIAAEPDRLSSDDRRKVRRYSYVDRGRYLPQLQRVCQYYPRESLLVLLFEELCNDPLETFRAACQFLDIDDSFVPPRLGEARHRRVPARSFKLRAITRRFPLLHRVIDPINTPAQSYPPMDPEVRAELVERFKEDNAALASWLGRDLSVWEK